MSEVQSDRQVIDDGRKSTLKGVEAPLRDRIVSALYDKLQDQNIGQKVSNVWTHGLANRSLWNERQLAWLESWDQYLMGDSEGEFSGSSNLHIPMPFSVCKTLHARYMQAIWQDPPFNCRAQNEASLERVPVVRDTMRYYIMRGANHNKGVGKTVDQWVWDWITLGSGVLKLRWDVTYTKFRDVRTVLRPKRKFALVDGKEVMVDATYEAEEEFDNIKKCFDGPVFDLVDLEDLLIVGGGGDPDLADSVIHRQYLTASDLWTLADRGVFNADAVKTVIDAGPNRMDGGQATDIKRQRAENAGRASLDTEYDLDRYEILECYLKVDVDGSGINSDVIVWIHEKTRELLRATYLYRVSKAGERPFAKIDFQPRKGQEHGVGMVEMLYPLSKEMDAHHNMRIDFGLVSTMPFGFYRPSSGIDPQTIKYSPGTLIPCDNPQTDVFFPNLGNRTAFGFQEEAAIQQMVERLTSVSDLSFGMMSGQGATRTATGARALVGEMSSNLDVYLRRLNFGWEKALRCLLHLLQQRIPKGISFRLTGDDGQDYWRQLKSTADIAGDFDIEVSPNSASSNQGIQVETAQQILQLASNPMGLQLGVVGPGQYYEAMRNLLQALGVKDWGRYLTKPQGYEYTLTPVEELNRVLRGMSIPVTPNMDHEGYISLWEEWKGNDELLGQIDERMTVAAEAQARQHAQMLAAVQQMAAQQANSQQMNMNAQQAQQQTPTTMSPMAGGMQPQ